MLLVPQHKQTKQFLLATLAQKGEKKLVSRCQLLCLSRRFSFAHAWILYQRGLIRIKCLKAFQTPGDLNNFWLDLQTKQTIMMQACVKMYTAVKQQMPALDVFINVFSSSFHQLFPHIFTVLDFNTGVTSCWLLQRCKEKASHKFMHKNGKKCVICCFCPGLANANFPRDGKGDCSMFCARRNQKYSNIPPVCWGTTTILLKRCIF